MSYCVFIIRQFKEGSCLIVFLLLDRLRRVHVLMCFVWVCLRIVMSNILLYQMSLRSEFRVAMSV